MRRIEPGFVPKLRLGYFGDVIAIVGDAEKTRSWQVRRFELAEEAAAREDEPWKLGLHESTKYISNAKI